jgi:hypothetical protein
MPGLDPGIHLPRHARPRAGHPRLWVSAVALDVDGRDKPGHDDRCKCGRATLGWAETQQTPLRGASAQFLTSGSYHALADQLRVGWHPEFKSIFEVS